MWWLIGLIIAGIYGIAQKILGELQEEVAVERKRWEDSYQDVQREVREQQRKIENALQLGREKLKVQELSDLHAASKRIADTTHELLQGSRKTLDAMGRAIVEAAKQRRIIENKKHGSLFGTGEMEKQIQALHKLRDEILIPDKDKVKAQRDQLLAEVQRLNKQTAELRDMKNALIDQNKQLRLEESKKWKEKDCSSCGAKIKYHIEWDKIPDICKSCADKARAKWREKPCSSCGTPIRYHADWSNIPSLCKSCLETKRAQWLTKPCADCGSSIKYHVEWNNPPKYCDTCNEKRKTQWKSKACTKCGKTFNYHIEWKRIPSLCNNCKPPKVKNAHR